MSLCLLSLSEGVFLYSVQDCDQIYLIQLHSIDLQVTLVGIGISCSKEKCKQKSS